MQATELPAQHPYGKHDVITGIAMPHDPPPTTVIAPNWLPVTSGTEHDVWNPTSCPATVISLSAPKDPVIVNVSPSETVPETPCIEMVAVAGYVPVSAPYALESC